MKEPGHGEQSPVLNSLLQTHELHVACSSCYNQDHDITSSTIHTANLCAQNVLLARERVSTGNWMCISPRPKYRNPARYVKCAYLLDGGKCTQYGKRCTFAKSTEEAHVWNFLKSRNLEHSALIRLVKKETQGLLDPEGVVERIRRLFPGLFIHLCHPCFYSSPQQITAECPDKVCGHPPKPTLVLFKIEEQADKVTINEVRAPPLGPRLQRYRHCWHVAEGGMCRYGPIQCSFPHSEVEMAVWTAESNEGLDRNDLLLNLKEQEAPAMAWGPRPRLYCAVCQLQFSSQDGFVSHCSSLAHERRYCEDSTAEWTHRRPPEYPGQALELCKRPETCEYGDNCTAAHSVEELQEWCLRMRMVHRKRRFFEEQGLLSYRDLLLIEYRDSNNEILIMSEDVEGVTVTCDKDLNVSSEQEDLQLKWTFTIKSERPLKVAALLKQEPGATFALGEDTSGDPCAYSVGDRFRTLDASYALPVSFASARPGRYEQWLVLDFDTRPVLLQKLRVGVGEKRCFPKLAGETHESSSPTPEPLLTPLNVEPWHRGNKVIISYLNETEVGEELLKEYKPPRLNPMFNPAAKSHLPLTRKNYRERMHSFLYREELAQEGVLSRLSLQSVIVSFSNIVNEPLFSTMIMPAQKLYASVPLSHALTPYNPEGQLLRTAVRSALVAPSPSADNRVYEAIVLHDVSSEDRIYLQLSRRCCSNLGLRKDTTCVMDIQFQLNRLEFCKWHQAVDLLPDVERVLPDLSLGCVSECSLDFPYLNAKQKTAIALILGEVSEELSTAPLLIYGPFGTGKTFTLAIAVMELLKQPGTRVLICTHTNSSADLYVKDHFHQYVESGHPEARPLRIKANRQGRAIRTTDNITLCYCLVSHDCQSFLFPKRSDLDSHQLVITTTMTARHLHDLKLPAGYFTHILIDEASQMLECAALMPLGLAGMETRIVLAGDHMQMGPKLFSVVDGCSSDHTLLNRLFHYYQEQEGKVASSIRVIFNENYRCTREIVDFVTTHFYVGKSDVIKASGKVPPHPRFHPLRFHHVRGTCRWDKESKSWFNSEEVTSVIEIVEELLKEWPSEWGNREQQDICILSEGWQVKVIRKELRKRKLGKVIVENGTNVQGMQFRAILMTAVHTRDSLLSSERAYPELFGDARFLNTAITRAQSQVVAIGDAPALCYFGKCSKIWKSYIKLCIDKGSANPQNLTMGHIEQEVKEISFFYKAEKDYDSDLESSESDIVKIEDPILRELLDESKDVQVIITEEGLLEVIQKAIHGDLAEIRRLVADVPHCPGWCDPDIHQRLRTHPNNFKRCELIMEKFDSGYAIPVDQPRLRININGRENVGRSFPGDLVAVEILSDEDCSCNGKVVGVLEREPRSAVFVCAIDKYDPQVMTPINKCVSKIFTPFVKNKPNFVAVQKQVAESGHWIPQAHIKINEYSRQNQLFVVEVLKWVKPCRYPLGVVTKVFNKATFEEDGLEVLNIEYQLTRHLPEFVKKDLKIDLKNRKDFRNYMTFTIDLQDSKDLDDAISVRDLGEHYEIGVHITDVASFVSKGSEIDQHAEKLGHVHHRLSGEPAYLFPRKLREGYLSLLPDHERHALSLTVLIEKKSDRILERSLALSLIKSNRQMTYEKAEKLIREHYVNHQCPPEFEILEDCLAVSYHFSEVHRRHRVSGNWRHVQPDEGVHQGKGMAHDMVKELMIMYNSFVSDFLITNVETRSLTPLKCQDSPDTKKVCQFITKHSLLMPFSVHLSHLQDENTDLESDDSEGQSADDRTLDSEESDADRDIGGDTTKRHDLDKFSVFTPLFKRLETAAQNKDVHAMLYLITADDIHPQLQPVAAEFRRLCQKAYIHRSNSTPQSKVGHHDLQLDSYTWASSPMRRYMDIIVQRLLHSVLEKSSTKDMYNSQEIDLFCALYMEKCAKKEAFDTDIQNLKTVIYLSDQSAQMMAVVNDLYSMRHKFQVFFPLSQVLLPQTLSIKYTDLKLADQPEYNQKSHSMTLRWKQRVYSFKNRQIQAELEGVQPNSHITAVQTTTWKTIVSAIRAEDWNKVLQCVQEMKSSMNRVSKDVENIDKCQHYTKISLELKVGQSLPVQLGTDTSRGKTFPAVQLVNIHPQFEICLEHAKNPMCFSKPALKASQQMYRSYEEYMEIWGSVCAVDTAYNAVAENDSIIFEGVKLTWKDSTKGYFRLSTGQKKEWSIECDLHNCFLCIRLRGQTRNVELSEIYSPLDLEEPLSFTWVAHGVTTKITGEKKPKKVSYAQVDFSLNHLSMENTPWSVFSENATFTVELIPKKLPFVLREQAIANLHQANNLVKNIAMGKITFDTSMFEKYFGIEDSCSQGLPPLNESQNDAIKKALEMPFTLIQGPPGTGKTVVGIHIVYWFFKRNQEAGTTEPNTHNEKGSVKKNGILYCGPSNKSVDIVAEQLLKLRGVKPLRVYSKQIEMLEFPYPGSHLKVCRKSLREEKPNEALRSIAMRYLIRENDPLHPFSNEIRSFDDRIKSEEDITDNEIARYRKLLKDARQHELLSHDVVLCTCSAASDPIFLKTMNFRQILIDECAMAAEPEAMIALIAHNPEQIVLLGDHKQLQPIIQGELVNRLGMNKSLFERYMKEALMLDTQYRMHEGICEFPSETFYNGSLKTKAERKPSALLSPSKERTPILFGHVEGQEVTMIVSTEKGNENSTANVEEAEQAVRVARLLISHSGIKPASIAILTPYNAQVSKINSILSDKGIKDVVVCSIMKSQGSEWRYVILSTVRSCPSSEIYAQVPRPTKAWLSRKLGFVASPNQLNVGITRAQDGLCIIGNQHLLKCNHLWGKLLKHYQDRNCVVDSAKEIQVLKQNEKLKSKRNK